MKGDKMALGRSTSKYKDPTLSDEDKIFNLTNMLQDSRDDLITLLGIVRQALRAIDVDNYKLKSTAEIAVLQNGADYLIEKYGVKKWTN
jgi:hypothetical protein